MKYGFQILNFFIFFLLTGCVTLYKPNTINSPLLKEKGDLHAAAAFGLSGSGLYNIQSAYAVSDHIGIMINGMYHNSEFSSNNNSMERLNMYFGEAGGGYFSTFGKNNKGLFQCYGGMGYGSTTDKIENSTQVNPEVSAEYINVFIQPGIGHIEKNVEIENLIPAIENSNLEQSGFINDMGFDTYMKILNGGIQILHIIQIQHWIL